MTDGRTYAVVLAAGAGSRFGGAKLVAAWNGGTLLDAALRVAAAAPVAGVVVVTGAHAELVEPVVAAFAARADLAMSSIRCADHALGMAASRRRGLSALPPDAAAAFIFLGDMPRIPAGLADRLHERVASGALAAAPTFGDRLGHPVLISRALFAAFGAGAGDGGGGSVLRGLGDALARVPVRDDGVLADVDTPADLANGASTPR